MAEKTADKPPAYVHAWTPDPMVVVSKRTRVVEFPAALLTRDLSAAEVDAKRADPAKPGASYRVTLMTGVTFLGALTTQWEYVNVHSRETAPRTPPSVDVCRLVSPDSSANAMVMSAGHFKARDDEGRPTHEHVDAARVSEAWERVLAYLQRQEEALIEAGAWLPAPLFAAQRGFDAPELTVGRLSDFLQQRREEHRTAYPYLTANLRGVRDGRHLGAFHDYCVRSDRGWNLAAECRTALVQRPGLSR